jgi:hypothetical protein
VAGNTVIADQFKAAGYRDLDSVGGITEVPDLSNLPQDISSTRNEDHTLPIAAGVAIGAISATGAVLRISRRRSS